MNDEELHASHMLRYIHTAYENLEIAMAHASSAAIDPWPAIAINALDRIITRVGAIKQTLNERAALKEEEDYGDASPVPPPSQ